MGSETFRFMAEDVATADPAGWVGEPEPLEASRLAEPAQSVADGVHLTSDVNGGDVEVVFHRQPEELAEVGHDGGALGTAGVDGSTDSGVVRYHYDRRVLPEVAPGTGRTEGGPHLCDIDVLLPCLGRRGAVVMAQDLCEWGVIGVVEGPRDPVVPVGGAEPPVGGITVR